MSKNIKLLIILIIMVLILFIIPNTALGASASISAGNRNLEVGKSTNIYVNISNTETWNLKISNSGGILSGTTDSTDANGEETSKQVISATFTANSAGTYTISLSGQIAGSDLIKQNVNQSITITVSEPAPTVAPTAAPTPVPTATPTTAPKPTNTNTYKPTPTPTPSKSRNSDLASLEIAEGVISPEFSSSTTEYTISVPNEVTTLSISAVADSSKATTKIEGNEELQVGDNNITITVTAEDGSTSTYTIVAKRANAELALASLSIYYIDENGEKVDIGLSPEFSLDKYEYKLEKIVPHTVKDILVEGISNRENATIEITGNQDLKSGKNEITIRVTVQTEEGLEEQKTYSIQLEKEEEPVVVPLTTAGKIKNWFSKIGKGIAGFVTGNFEKITTTMLAVATATFIGLTIYFAYDYKKYQSLLSELAQYNKANLKGRANVALNTEGAGAENASKENENVQEIEKDEKPDISQVRLGGRGRRFK